MYMTGELTPVTLAVLVS